MSLFSINKGNSFFLIKRFEAVDSLINVFYNILMWKYPISSG